MDLNHLVERGAELEDEMGAIGGEGDESQLVQDDEAVLGANAFGCVSNELSVVCSACFSALLRR